MVDLRILLGVVVGSVVGAAVASQGAHSHCVPGRQPFVNTDRDRLLCDDAGHWVLTEGFFKH